ncbi:MAG: LysR family transcriptional regulator [Rhodospirillales bacterium]|nr:LysR family transcriptional regulator [Rhodospirillales bacterium]
MRHLTSLRYIEAVAKSGSIRRAAESLAINSTALNRRILAVEADLGVPIFERLPRGVRLSAAGEILLQHIRDQLGDMDRVKGLIADLSGERRGHVSIACSQALLPYFLPEQISLYRRAHPGVTFGVHVRDRDEAEQSLISREADIALVFEPVRMSDLELLLAVRQRIEAVLHPDHPLAAKKTLRLRECLSFPIALPTAPYGVRHLLENATRRSSLKLTPVVESDSFEFLYRHALEEKIVTLQIPLGLPPGDTPALVRRSIDTRDVPDGMVYVGQLKGRILPVAASRFCAQIMSAFAERYECI